MLRTTSSSLIRGKEAYGVRESLFQTKWQIEECYNPRFSIGRLDDVIVLGTGESFFKKMKHYTMTKLL